MYVYAYMYIRTVLTLRSKETQLNNIQIFQADLTKFS